MGFDIDAEIERFDGTAWHHVGTAWDLGWHPGRAKQMFAALTGDKSWSPSEERITVAPRGCPDDATTATRRADDLQHIIANHFAASDLCAFAKRRLDSPCSWWTDLRALINVLMRINNFEQCRLIIVLRS